MRSNLIQADLDNDSANTPSHSPRTSPIAYRKPSHSPIEHQNYIRPITTALLKSLERTKVGEGFAVHDEPSRPSISYSGDISKEHNSPTV